MQICETHLWIPLHFDEITTSKAPHSLTSFSLSAPNSTPQGPYHLTSVSHLLFLEHTIMIPNFLMPVLLPGKSVLDWITRRTPIPCLKPKFKYYFLGEIFLLLSVINFVESPFVIQLYPEDDVR